MAIQHVAAFVVTLAGFAGARQEPAAGTPAAPISIPSLDAAIQRGARWLRGQQREDGAFEPELQRDTCHVALSAMALWALNEPEPRCIEAAEAERAARFLLANLRANGGLYDPAYGLAVYSSGVAARALRTLGKREDWPELAAAVSTVELFTYRRVAPESIVDATRGEESSAETSAEAARELLKGTPKDDEARRKALEFLARCRRDAVRPPARLRQGPGPSASGSLGPFTYDDLLPFVYFDLAPEHQLALRARAALREYYTPDRNPDLTKRYGPDGFGPGTQGLYYYYFVACKALATFRERALVTADGVSHPWAEEIASRLVLAQRRDGAWANPDARWWEGEPLLATSYALLALKLCRAELARAASGR